MLDLRWIREDPTAFDRALVRRNAAPRSAEVLALDESRRKVQTAMQEAQNERNRLSKEIGAVKGKGGDAAQLMARVAALKDELARLEGDERRQGAMLDALLATLPNAPHESVPDGADETANVELRKVGTPPRLSFPPKDHVAIGEDLGLMDFDAAARISGARFVVLKGQLARLERAIAMFMLDLQTGEHGYTEVDVPHLVRDEALFGTGQLPKFAADLFGTTASTQQQESDILRAAVKETFNTINPFDFGTSNIDEVYGRIAKEIETTYRVSLAAARAGMGRWLIPTAEVPLTNLVREQILDEAALPMRVTAHTPCYRSEAGAAGKDTRGMIRQHQFSKVELVSIVHPEQSTAELERMTGCAEEVLKRLGLAYRVIALCTGDMGFSARKTYDIEVWLPGQDRYREISSCSDCGDFQARRMNARYRPKADAKGTKFVHTLNGSGLAVGRTLVAVLENYQNADGSVTVPEVLRPYMGGATVIRAHGA